MKRERARQIVLALAGLLCFALLYPLCSDLWHSHWLVDMNNNDCEPTFLNIMLVWHCVQPTFWCMPRSG